LSSTPITADSNPQGLAINTQSSSAQGATLELQLSDNSGNPITLAMQTNTPPAAGSSYNINATGNASNDASFALYSGTGANQQICYPDKGTLTVNQADVTWGSINQTTGAANTGSVQGADISFTGAHCGSASSSSWVGKPVSGCANVQNAGTNVVGN
jgi:hypothetical protein